MTASRVDSMRINYESFCLRKPMCVWDNQTVKGLWKRDKNPRSKFSCWLVSQNQASHSTIQTGYEQFETAYNTVRLYVYMSSKRLRGQHSLILSGPNILPKTLRLFCCSRCHRLFTAAERSSARCVAVPVSGHPPRFFLVTQLDFQDQEIPFIEGLYLPTMGIFLCRKLFPFFVGRMSRSWEARNDPKDLVLSVQATLGNLKAVQRDLILSHSHIHYLTVLRLEE